MTTRRLEPSGNYRGSVWGSLPPPYPTDQAERVYRYLLDQMPDDSIPRALMGQGFKGVAYRFRATTEYQAEFENAYQATGGVAPPVDDHYRQERALFGFFVSGLACIESFAFALHAIGAYYKPSNFALSARRLKGIKPSTVASSLLESWPSALVTSVFQEVVRDDTFQTWKEVRNVLSHRVVPSRSIVASSEAGITSTWRLIHHHLLDNDEPLEFITLSRRPWLNKVLCDLWDGVEQSFPPP